MAKFMHIDGKEQFRQLSKMIRQATKGFRDWRPVWRDVAPHMVDSIRANIRSQGANINVRWPELSEPYRTRKGGGAMLILRGKMINRVRSHTIRKMSVKAGYRQNKNADKAAAHDVGSRKKNLPPRPFVRVAPPMARRVFREADDHISKVLEEMLR